jgi:hypothetical protein
VLRRREAAAALRNRRRQPLYETGDGGSVEMEQWKCASARVAGRTCRRPATDALPCRKWRPALSPAGAQRAYENEYKIALRKTRPTSPRGRGVQAGCERALGRGRQVGLCGAKRRRRRSRASCVCLHSVLLPARSACSATRTLLRRRCSNRSWAQWSLVGNEKRTSRVRPHVLCEGARLREGHAACVSAMGLLPRMRPHVLGEGARLREGHATCVSAMGLLPRMRPYVSGDGARRREGHAACAACEL